MKKMGTIGKICLALLITIFSTTMATEAASKALTAASTVKKQVVKKELAKDSKDYTKLCLLYEKALLDKIALGTAVMRQAFELNEEKLRVQLDGITEYIQLDEVPMFLNLFKSSYESNLALLNNIKSLNAKYILPKTIQINYNAVGAKKKSTVAIKLSDFEAREKMLKNAMKILEANNKPVVKKPIDINSADYKNYVALVEKYLNAKTTIIYFTNNTPTHDLSERMISISIFENMTLEFPFAQKSTFYDIVNSSYQNGKAVIDCLTALERKYKDIPSRLEVTENIEGYSNKIWVEIKKGDLQNEIDSLSRAIDRINNEK